MHEKTSDRDLPGIVEIGISQNGFEQIHDRLLVGVGITGEKLGTEGLHEAAAYLVANVHVVKMVIRPQATIVAETLQGAPAQSDPFIHELDARRASMFMVGL